MRLCVYEKLEKNPFYDDEHEKIMDLVYTSLAVNIIYVRVSEWAVS